MSEAETGSEVVSLVYTLKFNMPCSYSTKNLGSSYVFTHSNTTEAQLNGF